MKGIRIAGKISYVTSFLPYIILFSLAIRSFTLPGAKNGLLYFLLPKWEKLGHISIWTDAATQTIFSLGPGCGCVLTLSSFNKKDKNCFRDAIIIGVINCSTSLFCGLVVFAMLGFMAHESGKPIEQVMEFCSPLNPSVIIRTSFVFQVVQGGPGLAFIIYPEIVTKMSLPNLWAILFFSMLILLALGSIFGAFETINFSLRDHITILQSHPQISVLILAASMFLLGLPFTCPGGIHFFTVFNYAAPSWNLLLITLLELLCVGWVFKAEKLLDKYEEIGITMSKGARRYWIVCWKYLSPGVLTVLLIMSLWNFGSVKLGSYTYPLLVQVLANLLTLVTIAWIPIFAISHLARKITWRTEHTSIPNS